MTNQSLVKHIKVYHTEEIPKLRCSYKGYKELIGSKSALKQHKKWHFDIQEKKERKRDEQIAKEKEKLEQQQKERERQNLKRKSSRKVTQSSPAKLVVPIPREGPGSSTESGDSTESTETTEPMCE